MEVKMMIATAVGIVSLVSAISGGGFWVANTLNEKADKPIVLAVDDKANYVLDKQMESTLSQINKLEAKQNKTQDDREQLKYLREDLQRSREIRKQR